MIKKLLLFTCLLTCYQCWGMEEGKKDKWDALDKRAKQLQDKKKWEAFDKRAEQMQKEQERRKHPSVTTEEGDGYRNVNVDFGQEGIPVDDFIDMLREIAEEKKEEKGQREWETVGFSSNVVDENLEKEMMERGFEQNGQNKGAFYKPGSEAIFHTLMKQAKEKMKEKDKKEN